MIKKIFNYFINHKRSTPHEIPKGIFINDILIANAEPGEWIKIIPIGSYPFHHNGAHDVTKEHIDQMVTNFNATGKELLIDWEHKSLWGDTRAAGWINKLEAREDGLYCNYPEFTKSAKEQIDDREYRYFSPVYKLESINKNGDSIGAIVDSVAITNRPYFDNEIDHIGNSESTGEPDQTEIRDTSKNHSIDMKLNKEALAKLGLDENATEEQVNEAILNSAAPEAEETTDEPETTKTNSSEEKPQWAKDLEKKFDDQEKVNKAAQVDALINSAISEGKILPADKPAWEAKANSDFAGAKKILDERKANSAMPAGVKVSDEHSEDKKSNSVAFAELVAEKTPQLAK
ncbi:MAG: phage protease [Balneola sp.]